jgi:hypothetical protein
MALTLRAAAVAAALTTTTILAAPAAAAPLVTQAATSTYFAPSGYDPAAETAQWGCRRYCGRGWGRRGWRGGWRRNRIDGGDVLIGAAIIGGAIAIANSTRRRERDRDVVVIDRDLQFRDRDDRRDDRRADVRRTGSAGLDNAVDMCVERIERDVRIDAVDNVERTAGGWQVSGNIFNGARFVCRIGNDGRIDGIDYDGTFGVSSGTTSPMPMLAPASVGQCARTSRCRRPPRAAASPSHPLRPVPPVRARSRPIPAVRSRARTSPRRSKRRPEARSPTHYVATIS